MTSRTVDGATTAFNYDAVGQLQRVTFATRDYLVFEYDLARRLTDIHQYGADDAHTAHLHYTLDTRGNRVREDTCETETCASTGIARTIERVYNELDQLAKLIAHVDGTVRHTTGFLYDANANLTATIDPRDPDINVIDPLPADPQIASRNLYDALNRVRQTVDAEGGVTLLAYGVLDKVEAVIAPNNAATSYDYNGFGELTQKVSPDAGTTAYTYDEAANRKTEQNANHAPNERTEYNYDALNRSIAIHYVGAGRDIAMHYDDIDHGDGVATNGVGRMTRMVDETGMTRYWYDRRGQVTKKRACT